MKLETFRSLGWYVHLRFWRWLITFSLTRQP